MRAYFLIGDKEYGVEVVMVEPYRAATFHDPAEGELAAGEEVHVYKDNWQCGTVSYDEFLELLKAEWDDADIGKTEDRIQRRLWEAYHKER